MKINIPLDQQVVERKIAEGLTEKLASVGIEVAPNYEYISFDIGKNYTFGSVDACNDLYNEFIKTRHVASNKGDDNIGDLVDAVDVIPAPTLPELLAVLPDKIYFSNGLAIRNEKFYLMLDKECLRYYKVLENGKFDFITKSEWTIRKGTSPATAAAKLLIWCIDNGYINGVGG